jgi:hypothetical protein
MLTMLVSFTGEVLKTAMRLTEWKEVRTCLFKIINHILFTLSGNSGYEKNKLYQLGHLKFKIK